MGLIMAGSRIQRLTVAAAGALLTIGVVAGCSDDSSSSGDSSPTSSVAAMSSMPSSMDMGSGAAAAPANLVGPGCSAYAEANLSGPASVGELAKQPLATAATNVPILKTLAQAVSGKLNPDVNLVNTLNNGQYTLFAPTDDAFAKLDAATVDKLKTDSALLTKILTYHVVSGQVGPDQIAGTHKTVEGQDVTVTGSGNDWKVNNSSSVVCGGIKTANATVYLIDTVLMPPM